VKVTRFLLELTLLVLLAVNTVILVLLSLPVAALLEISGQLEKWLKEVRNAHS
jgi:hypothetical protein